MRDTSIGGFLGLLVLGLILLGGFAFGFPLYRVWSEGLKGKAELARAEQNRKIAEYDALAEVERAKGVAQANKIIAEGLGGPEGYLRYLWINQLSNNRQSVVYVPTETGMPILEAGHRPKTAAQKEDK
jgi:hypothetical protein